MHSKSVCVPPRLWRGGTHKNNFSVSLKLIYYKKKSEMVHLRIFKMILKRLRIKNMYRKILLTQLVFAIIPLTIIAVYMAHNFNRNIVTNHRENLSSRLAVTALAVENKTERYLNRSDLIINNGYSLSTIKNIIKKEYEALLDMQSLISSFTLDLVSQRLRAVYFTIFINGYSFDDSIYIESISNFANGKLREEILRLRPDQVVWEESLYREKEQSFMVFYRNVSAYKAGAFLRGYIPYSEISELLGNAFETEPNMVAYHKSRTGEILYFKDNDNSDRKYKDFNPEGYLLMSSEPFLDGSVLTVGLNRNAILSDQYMNYAVIIALFIVLLIVVFMITSMTAERIIKSLNTFVDTISYDENQLLTEFQEVEEGSDDEVSIIKKRFVGKLQEIDSAQKLMLDVQNDKNMLEMNLLQSRLNPHMLYNSLSTIRMCAAGNDSKKTMEIVDTLSQYYRLALNNGIDVVTVAQEIELVKQYIDIIQLTYSKEYRLEVDIEEALQGKKIFKHLIQPVVENALHHGLRGLPGEAVIHITGRIIPEMENGSKMFEFKVIDNGFGMDEGTIQKLISMEYVSPHGGFGIKNLLQKMRLFYGEDANLTIESAVNEGSVITLLVKEIL